MNEVFFVMATSYQAALSLFRAGAVETPLLTGVESLGTFPCDLTVFVSEVGCDVAGCGAESDVSIGSGLLAFSERKGCSPVF